MIECLVLGTGAVVARDAVTIEYLKSKQLELSEEEKQEFLEDKDRRFIHFTSEKNAKDIMKSGFLIPTKGIIDNHFTKSIDNKGRKKDSDMVYMFDSKTFSVDDYIRNLPKNRSPFNGCYEYYAVSTKPNEYEINNFKRRAQDGAITYEGRLDIDGTDTRLSKYILELSEQGEYELNEVAMDYEYIPSQELLDKLEQDKMGSFKYALTTYMSEVKKARTSLRKYRAQKEEYKEQIRKKKEFAKANRQFIEEEKDKSYVYEKDGRTIVVKNVEYEQVGGKKLQKIAIIENNEQNKNTKIQETTKFCYMDEYNIENISKEVATQYFFNNLDDMNESKNKLPKYIGLPEENLETGEVRNEYDTTFDKNFRKYMDDMQKTKERNNIKEKEFKESRKWTSKLKSMFSKFFGKKKDLKLLEESKTNEMYPSEDRDALASLGYSSVEAMNKDDKEAEMFAFLNSNTKSVSDINEYYVTEDTQRSINNEERTVEER